MSIEKLLQAVSSTSSFQMHGRINKFHFSHVTEQLYIVSVNVYPGTGLHKDGSLTVITLRQSQLFYAKLS